MAIKVKYDKVKGLVQSKGTGFEIGGQTTITGRVGIGIKSPGSTLHVSSSSTTTALFRVDHNDSADILFVTGSGRIGINTPVPATSLEIVSSSADPSPSIRISGLSPKLQFDETDQTIKYQITTGNRHMKWQVQDATWSAAKVKWLMNEDGWMAIRHGDAGAAIPSKFYISGSDSEKLLIVSGTNNPDVLAVLGSGRVGIGTSTPTAKLEIASTTEGFLPPRMTAAQRDAIGTPAAGLMIYNTDTDKLNFYNGSAWRAVDDSAV